MLEAQRPPGPKRHRMANHGTKSPSLGPGAAAGEGFHQHVTVVAVDAVDLLLNRRGQGVLVAVAQGQHGRALAVKAVQVGQAGAQAVGGIGELGPGVRVGRDPLGHPVRGAGQIQRHLVGEVAVDRQAGDAGLLGDAGDGGGRRADGPVQVDRGLDDPLVGLVDLLGALPHPVRPRVR